MAKIFDALLAGVIGGLGDATRGALDDIRNRWEEAWFGHAVTPPQSAEHPSISIDVHANSIDVDVEISPPDGRSGEISPGDFWSKLGDYVSKNPEFGHDYSQEPMHDLDLDR